MGSGAGVMVMIVTIMLMVQIRAVSGYPRRILFMARPSCVKWCTGLIWR